MGIYPDIQPRRSGRLAQFARRSPVIALIAVCLGCIGLLLAGFFSAMYAISYYPGHIPTEIARAFARAAYAGRVGAIQYDPACGMYDPELSYRLRPGSCRFARTEFDTTYLVQ